MFRLNLFVCSIFGAGLSAFMLNCFIVLFFGAGLFAFILNLFDCYGGGGGGERFICIYAQFVSYFQFWGLVCIYAVCVCVCFFSSLFFFSFSSSSVVLTSLSFCRKMQFHKRA